MNTEPASLPSREAELRTQRSQAELGNEENAPARQAGSTDWLDQVDFVVKTFLRPQALLRLLNEAGKPLIAVRAKYNALPR